MIKNTCWVVKHSDMDMIKVIMPQNDIDVVSLEYVKLVVSYQFGYDAVVLKESIC